MNMELKETMGFVTELMDRLERSSVGTLELEVPGLKIRLEKAAQAQASPVAVAPAPVSVAATNEERTPEPPAVSAGSAENAPAGNIVRSPMVGTFYAAPAPDAPPFVKVGDRVKKGDVLCIIEAMKMMNEIESEYDGVVASVLAANGSLVEFDQPIIVIT